VGKAHKSKKIIHSSFPSFFGGEAAVLFIYFYRTIVISNNVFLIHTITPPQLSEWIFVNEAAFFII
jgi:hypothetical protein